MPRHKGLDNLAHLGRNGDEADSGMPELPSTIDDAGDILLADCH